MSTIEACLDLNNPQNKASIVDLSLQHLQLDYWDAQSIAKQVDTIANQLYQITKNLPKTDEPVIIAFSFHNSIQQVILFLAISRLNCVALPLNFSYTQSEYQFYMSDVKVSLVIEYTSTYVRTDVIAAAVDALNAEEFKDSPILRAQMTLDEKTKKFNLIYEGTPLELKSELTFPEPDSEAVCLILHTSGTTSRPKAVTLTQRNLSTNFTNIKNTFDFDSSDKTILVMPLFHIHGIVCGVYGPLSAGNTVVIPEGGKFSASTFWKNAVEYQITWFTAVPTILQILVMRADQDYLPLARKPKLRFIRSSSAKLPIQVLEEAEKLFSTQILEGYSMTEASHQMTSNELRRPRKPGTVGFPQNVEVVIMDSEGRILPQGEIGEICIKGQNVTHGYLHNEEANAKAFKFGYFYTGDLGQFDSDGYLTICGRIKELINRGGEKINPAEVDDILLRHPDIKEVCCFPGPDRKYGECVCCAIVPKSPSTSLTLEDIRKFAAPLLASFKIPSQIYMTDTLPRTATGKVQRKHVAEHFLPQS